MCISLRLRCDPSQRCALPSCGCYCKVNMNWEFEHGDHDTILVDLSTLEATIPKRYFDWMQHWHWVFDGEIWSRQQYSLLSRLVRKKGWPTKEEPCAKSPLELAMEKSKGVKKKRKYVATEVDLTGKLKDGAEGCVWILYEIIMLYHLFAPIGYYFEPKHDTDNN